MIGILHQNAWIKDELSEISSLLCSSYITISVLPCCPHYAII